MQKLSLLLLLALGLTFSGAAEPPHGEKGKSCNKNFDYKSLSPEQRAEKMVEKLDKTLSLTDDQANLIQQIKTESFNVVEKIRAPFEPTLTKMHEEMKSLKESQSEVDNLDRSNFKAIKEKYSADLQPMHEALAKQRQMDKEKINAVLTEEQKAIFNSKKSGVFHEQKKPCNPH